MITTITVFGALSPAPAELGHNWLDVSADSAAAVIDGWLGNGASVTYLPQGRTTVCRSRPRRRRLALRPRRPSPAR